MTTATAEAPASTDTEIVDIEKFKRAVELTTVAEAGDPKSNGTKHVRAEFTALGRKSRKAAKEFLASKVRETVMSGDTEGSQKFLLLTTNGVKTVSGGAASTAKSSSEVLLENIKVLQIAYNLATATATEAANNGDEVLTGWDTKIDITAEDIEASKSYAAYIEADFEGDEPEATAVQKAGARVSLGKGPKGQGRKPKAAEDAAEGTPAPAPEAPAADAPATDPGAGPAPE